MHKVNKSKNIKSKIMKRGSGKFYFQSRSLKKIFVFDIYERYFLFFSVNHFVTPYFKILFAKVLQKNVTKFNALVKFL